MRTLPGKAIGQTIIIIVMVLLAFVFLFPVLFMLTNSLMSAFEVANRYTINFNPYNSFGADTPIHYAQLSLIPTWATFKQYLSLFFGSPFYLGLFFNSVMIALPAVVGQVLVAVPAAYAFEVTRFRWKEPLFFVYIVIMLLPLQVTIVPNYIVSQFFHIEKSYWAIILPAIFSPFGVFLLRQFMKGLPYEYIEAAKIDGAGNIRVLTDIVLPLMKPAIVSLIILIFIEYWNVVDQAVVFIPDSVRQPLSVYLSSMMGDNGMGMIFAASCFYMLPVVLVFLYGKEYLIEGIQLSGLK